ncbi:MAG: hypothetical protein ABEI13_01070, partial [Candidatus Paceibacteria bacterium]
MNTIAKTQNYFNKFWEISDDLVDFASACQELDGEIPKRVEHRYRDTKEEAMLILGDVQDNI